MSLAFMSEWIAFEGNIFKNADLADLPDLR